MKTTIKSIKYLFVMFFAFNVGVLTAFVIIYNNQENENTSVHIINRYINFKEQEFYNKSDLDLIIWGEIQPTK